MHWDDIIQAYQPYYDIQVYDFKADWILREGIKHSM